MPETRASRSDFVQSLERGLAVIRAFDSEHRDLRLSDVAASAGLTRAAARRFLLTLVDLGYMRLENGRFSLRPRVLELGYAYLSSLGFADIAQPHMETLAHELNESSSVSVLDDLDIVYVVRVPTRRIMTITLAVGTRLPAFHTSLGRVQLGRLDDAELWCRLRSLRIEAYTPSTITDMQALYERVREDRAQGFSIVDEELERGLRSIAVPILDRAGELLAGLNISTHSTRTTRNEMRDRFLPRLRAVAEQVSALLA